MSLRSSGAVLVAALVWPLVVEPSWLGRRVSVRRVLDHGAAGRPQFGDVVGDLAGLDAQTAVIDTASGLVEVPLATVALARLAPPSTADELALEAIAAQGLRPAETEQLGGWLLRAHHGFTRRANSVLPLRQLGMPLDAAVDAAARWYAARGLPLRIQVPVEARRLLDAELGERGWPAEAYTHLCVARLDRLPTADATDLPVTVDPLPDRDWLALYRGGAGLDAAARELLVRHDRVGFAGVRVDGRLVAVGRGAVDAGWVGVSAVEVTPGYRRRGLAHAVTLALCRWGAEHGATRSYLQVEADNAAALALYEKLGYWIHHDYHYRSAPGS
jgi:ribosomal protein S18 acetylase RimI-like enzyme